MPPGKILIVDDAPASLEQLLHRLADWGYEVTLASHGVEALQRAGRSRPDLLITELSLPDMDGVELCRRFEAQPDLRLVPVIVASALPKLPVALHGRVEAFFPKPLDLDRLLNAIAFYVPDE